MMKLMLSLLLLMAFVQGGFAQCTQIEDCATCAAKDAECTGCSGSKVLTSTGTCADCSIASCDDCVLSGTTPNCKQCATGNGLSGDKTTCVACPGQCTACTDADNNDVAECSTCNPGFGLADDKSACEDCSTLAGCFECVGQAGGTGINCLKCASGYVFDNAGTACVSCLGANGCLACTVDASDAVTACSSCPVTTVISQDGSTCDNCPANCDKCSYSGADLLCDQCEDNFSPTADKKICMDCSTVNTDCVACTASTGSTPDKCTACDDNTVLSADELKCSSCPAGCKTCSDTTNSGTGTCTACDDGYGVDAILGCELCNTLFPGCVKCTDSTSDGTADKCTQCGTGFLLENGACVTCTSKISGCAECDSATVCTKCSSGYGLHLDKSACEDCSGIMTDCGECKGPGQVCSDCDDGYLPNDDKTQCLIKCYECANTTDCGNPINENSVVSMCPLGSGGCWTIRYQVGTEHDYERMCGPACTAQTKQEDCDSAENAKVCKQCCDDHLCNENILKDGAADDKPLQLWLLLAVAILTAFIKV